MRHFAGQSAWPRAGSSAAAIAWTLLSLGCAITSVRSQRDPQAPPRDYGKLMVFVKLKNLELRQDAEREFQRALAGHQTQIVPSLELFPAGQTPPKDAAHKILTDAGIDAVLVVVPDGHGVPTVYIPETTIITRQKDGTRTSETTGGYEQDGAAWAKYKATLHDRVTHKVAWVATMESREVAFAKWPDLVRSMARKTSERLIEDHIVQ